MDLSESWCEVQVKRASPEVTFCSVNDPSILEALLKEAQKEGSTTTQSRSGINTPLSFHGSNISPQELDKECADWIWDWSSRPEVNSGPILNSYYRMALAQPEDKGLSFRKSAFWRETNNFYNFCRDRLSFLLLTHACSFFIGATAVFIVFR